MSDRIQSVSIGEAYAHSLECERRADAQFKNPGLSNVVAARYAETAGRIEAAQERNRKRLKILETGEALEDPNGWVDTTTETDITKWLKDTQTTLQTSSESFVRPIGKKALKKGDFVKVCDNEQCLWAVLTRVYDPWPWIGAKVFSVTGREDRGYGERQLVRFELKHVYFRRSAAENKRVSAQIKMLEMIKSGALKEPDDDQDKLRRVATYAEDHWKSEPDMFAQGVDRVDRAMSMAPSHERIIAYYEARPDLLTRCGLKAGDIAIVYVCNRKQMRETLISCGGSTKEGDVSKESIENLYQCGYNLAVEHKIVCDAINEPDSEGDESDAEP
jgi:hypothetical protein